MSGPMEIYGYDILYVATKERNVEHRDGIFGKIVDVSKNV
jgi:hypothetical protein